MEGDIKALLRRSDKQVAVFALQDVVGSIVDELGETAPLERYLDISLGGRC